MALSLREKLQKASLATIATNAARTLAKLDDIEILLFPVGATAKVTQQFVFVR